MDNLSPHKTFRNLDDLSGIPGVRTSTPVPHRDNPLPGTKSMLFPKDGHLLESLAVYSMDEIKPPQTANVLGVLAMVAALGGIALFWVFAVPGSSHFDRLDAWLFFPGLAAVHVFGLLSHILSDGNNRLGGFAILVFYAGLLLSAVLHSFLP